MSGNGYLCREEDIAPAGDRSYAIIGQQWETAREEAALTLGYGTLLLLLSLLIDVRFIPAGLEREPRRGEGM